jgi:radical SAM superfamily enzyme YgiQ (UPF0313 family)
MYRAGCRFLWLGVESASPKIQSTIRKGISIPTVENIVRNCKKTGIFNVLLFISGLPGEDKNDVRITAEFLVRNSKNIDAIRVDDLKIPKKSTLAKNLSKYRVKIQREDPTSYYAEPSNAKKHLWTLWNSLKPENKSMFFQIEGNYLLGET